MPRTPIDNITPREASPDGSWWRVHVTDLNKSASFVLWATEKEEAIEELESHLATRSRPNIGDKMIRHVDADANTEARFLTPPYSYLYGLVMGGCIEVTGIDALSESESAIRNRTNKSGVPELMSISSYETPQI